MACLTQLTYWLKLRSKRHDTCQQQSKYTVDLQCDLKLLRMGYVKNFAITSQIKWKFMVART